MDDGRHHENGRHKMDYYRGAHSLVIRKHFLLRSFYIVFVFKYAILDPFEWNRGETCSGIQWPNIKQRIRML